MSVFFVYRSHSDNTSGFHVKVFPQDTVLEWFQSIWVGIPRGDDHPDAATDRAEDLLGCAVGGLDMLFVEIHNQGWAKPNTMTAAARHFEQAFYNEEMKFGQHHLQLLTRDELEVAIYIFDDHYAAKNPHRAAYLMREDWKLPDAAAEVSFKPKGVPKAVKLIHGTGATYFAHFAAYDTGSLTDLPDFGLWGTVAGVRVADFPRYLFALRNRIAVEPDDETVNSSLRDVLSGLDAVVEKATGDEAAFLATLVENPNDYAGWCAFSDWRMERDMPSLLTDVLRLHRPYSGSTRDTRDPSKDEAFVQTHVAQASKHVARWGETDLFHHFILFDDEWANAHRDLAASILRTASRWDPL